MGPAQQRRPSQDLLLCGGRYLLRRPATCCRLAHRICPQDLGGFLSLGTPTIKEPTTIHPNPSLPLLPSLRAAAPALNYCQNVLWIKARGLEVSCRQNLLALWDQPAGWSGIREEAEVGSTSPLPTPPPNPVPGQGGVGPQGPTWCQGDRPTCRSASCPAPPPRALGGLPQPPLPGGVSPGSPLQSASSQEGTG